MRAKSRKLKIVNSCCRPCKQALLANKVRSVYSLLRQMMCYRNRTPQLSRKRISLRISSLKSNQIPIICIPNSRHKRRRRLNPKLIERDLSESITHRLIVDKAIPLSLWLVQPQEQVRFSLICKKLTNFHNQMAFSRMLSLKKDAKVSINIP